MIWPFKRKKASKGFADIVSEDEEQRYKPIEWPLVRRLLTWLAPHRKRYTLAICVGLVYVLLDMLGPTFLQKIIDYGTSDCRIKAGGSKRGIIGRTQT